MKEIKSTHKLYSVSIDKEKEYNYTLPPCLDNLGDYQKEEIKKLIADSASFFYRAGERKHKNRFTKPPF